MFAPQHNTWLTCMTIWKQTWRPSWIRPIDIGCQHQWRDYVSATTSATATWFALIVNFSLQCPQLVLQHRTTGQFSSVQLFSHNTLRKKNNIKRNYHVTREPRRNRGAYRTWVPSLHKRIQIRKSLHGLMNYIDCLIKLPLNITRRFPYITLVTRTRKLECLIKLPSNLTRCFPYFSLKYTWIKFLSFPLFKLQAGHKFPCISLRPGHTRR